MGWLNLTFKKDRVIGRHAQNKAEGQLELAKMAASHLRCGKPHTMYHKLMVITFPPVCTHSMMNTSHPIEC